MIKGQFGDSGARIMSLRDGTAKMSKSDPSQNACIFLRDDAETISKKIKKAKSDADALPSEPDGLEGRPEAANLVGIYAALTGKTPTDVLGEYGGQGFGVFKPALADLVVEKISPISEELRRLEADPAYLQKVLTEGAERASAVAEPVVRDVKEIVGFLA